MLFLKLIIGFFLRSDNVNSEKVGRVRLMLTLFVNVKLVHMLDDIQLYTIVVKFTKMTLLSVVLEKF